MVQRRPADAIAFEPKDGELLLDGERIALTPLEFAVMEPPARQAREGRDTRLWRDVWGYGYEGGSNVVDSVVRSLRTRLCSHASSIETVRGFGYRSRL